MRRLLQRSVSVAAFVLAVAFAQTPGKRDAGGYPAPTPELERGRTVFVQSSCHFCHGVDLTGAAMGAANLMYSPLVGRDMKGNLIGPVVRAGLPNLQTAMPQYSDYTDQQISDLAAYIHYLRQQGRFKELTAMKGDVGDATAGKKYFNANCEKCHSQNLAGVAMKYKPAELREHFLRPAPAVSEHATAGALAHAKMLENYKNEDVSNVLAYLATLK